jgi:hypothetical protein
MNLHDIKLLTMICVYSEEAGVKFLHISKRACGEIDFSS